MAAICDVTRSMAEVKIHLKTFHLSQAILLFRFGLNNVLKTIASLSKSPVQWDKSKLYYVLREVGDRSGPLGPFEAV